MFIFLAVVLLLRTAVWFLHTVYYIIARMHYMDYFLSESIESVHRRTFFFNIIVKSTHLILGLKGGCKNFEVSSFAAHGSCGFHGG